MSAWGRIISAGIFVTLWASLAVLAATPRITLQLNDVTALQASEALGKAAQVPLRLYQEGLPPSKGSFNWKNVSLDTALRDLCARYGLACLAAEIGYALYPARLGRAEYAFTKGGIRIALSGVALQQSRIAMGDRERVEEPNAPATAVLSFLVDLDEAHGDWSARFEDVIARDLKGKALAATAFGSLDPTFPHQRIGTAHVQLPNPPQPRFSGVEGVLVLTQRKPGKRIEIPYPSPGGLQKKRIGTDLVVGAIQPRPAAKTPSDEHADLKIPPLQYPAFDVEKGPAVVMLARQPVNGMNPDASDSFPAPIAIGQSGRAYRGQSSSGGARRRDAWSVVYSNLYFPGAEEPLRKLVWELPGDPAGELRIPFRIDEVPLPKITGAPIQHHSVITERSPVLRAPEDLRQVGGGVLRSKVRIADSTGPSGVLRVSLSPSKGAVWQPSPWFEADVDAKGVAEIRDLLPGRYRLLQEFRLNELSMSHDTLKARISSPTGAWRGSHAEIEIKAGMVTEAPPLVLFTAEERVQAENAPETSVGSVKAETTYVRVQAGRTEIWEGPRWLDFYGRGSLSISGRFTAGGAPADRTLYLRNVSACDDFGTVVGRDDYAPAFSTSRIGRNQGGFSAELQAVHPQARKLRWFEADVYGFTRRRTIKLEMPYPEVGKNNVARDGDLVLTAGIDAAPKTPEIAGDDRVLLDFFDAGIPASPERRLRIRACYRDAVIAGAPGREEPYFPKAVGKSGAVYDPQQGGGMSRNFDEWVLHARQVNYPKAKEPLVRLRWEFDLLDKSQSAGTLRLENVALPQAVRLP